MQEEREAVRSGQTEVAALRERASAAEERLGREVELRQSAELQRREVELQARGNLVSTQQLQEKVAEQASQLQTEREAKAVQVPTHTHTHTDSQRRWRESVPTGGAVQGTAETVAGASDRICEDPGTGDRGQRSA